MGKLAVCAVRFALDWPWNFKFKVSDIWNPYIYDTCILERSWDMNFDIYYTVSYM